jgi:hypothetical protein
MWALYTAGNESMKKGEGKRRIFGEKGGNEKGGIMLLIPPLLPVTGRRTFLLPHLPILKL